jgi:hypothetical protein
MKATELLCGSLEGTKAWFLGLMQDMKASPLTFPTSKGGNHPLWVLGHLALAEASMVSGFVLGEPNPLAKWEGEFGINSEPVADASRYPSWDELMAEFEKTRAKTLRVLGSMSDDDLSKPSKAPAELAAFFGTVGQCFAMIGTHMAFHAGQVADARKAAGKKPVFG